MTAGISKTLSIPKGITAVIGSGGKTTLLRALAAELPGKIILTTTTHILPFEEYPTADSAAIRDALDRHRVICVGTPTDAGKLAAPPFPLTALLPLADYILVEADGSRQFPIKAHAPYEPVIPAGTSRTICVVGASGIGRPISACCHRPELFCKLTDTTPETILTPQILVRELVSEMKGMENVIIYVNQLDLLSDTQKAQLLSELRSACSIPVLGGSLQS